MKKIFAGLNFLLLTSILIACGSNYPQAATITPALLSTQTFTPMPPITLPWVELGNAQIASDLKMLLDLQAKRSAEDIALVEKWNTNPVVKWNEETRTWVMYYAQDPVVASREYALVSVAQQRALDEFARVSLDRAARKPGQLDAKIEPIIQTDPYEAAVLIGAAEPLFLYMFPDTQNEIHVQMDEARMSLLISGNILPVDLKTAEDFGSSFAKAIIEEHKDDGSAEANNPINLPTSEGTWHLDPFRGKAEQPGWSKVTPWLLSSADQFRVKPPPVFNSPEFEAQLDEVRQTLKTDTPRELAIALKWADKRGTYTPPGHWNEIASDLIEKYNLTQQDAAHVMAALNMSLMDAGIACWDSKFHYMVIRPWQADPNITPLVGYPNHPSYPSGHSCFSWAGAEVLSYFFPDERESLTSMAEEASISRLYGGLHYRMDMNAGKDLGLNVGRLADDFAKSCGWKSFKNQ